MNKTRLLLLTLLTFVIHTVVIMLTCGWLFSWVYALPPVEIWVPLSVMTNPQTQMSLGILGLLIAFFFVFVYAVIYKGIPGKTWTRGLMYGLLLWLPTSLGMASMIFLMNINPIVVVYWMIQALVISLLSGLFVGGWYKGK